MTLGTIEKTYDELQGVLDNRASVLDVVLASLQLQGVEIVRIPLMNKDSLEMTPEDHALIAETAEAARVAADQLPRERGLHEFFEAILNEIRQGVVIVDADMRITFANKPLANLLQRPAVHAGRTLIEELRDHQLIDLVQHAVVEKKRVTRQVQMLASSAAVAGRSSGAIGTTVAVCHLGTVFNEEGWT